MNPRAPRDDDPSLARLAGTAQACDTRDPIEPAVERHDPGNPAALHHGQVQRAFVLDRSGSMGDVSRVRLSSPHCWLS